VAKEAKEVTLRVSRFFKGRVIGKKGAFIKEACKKYSLKRIEV